MNTDWVKLIGGIIGAVIVSVGASHVDTRHDTSYLGTAWVGQSMNDQHKEIYSTIDRVTVLETTVSNLQQQIKTKRK